MKTTRVAMEQALDALLSAMPPLTSERTQAEFLVGIAVGYARTTNVMREEEVVEHVRKLYQRTFKTDDDTEQQALIDLVGKTLDVQACSDPSCTYSRISHYHRRS